VRIDARLLAAGKLVNSASVVAANGGVKNGRADSATIRVLRPKFTLTKRASRSRMTAGHAVSYRLTLRNSVTAAHDVRVCDRLPSGTSVVSSGGGRLNGSSVCWRVPSLPSGASRTFALRLRLDRTSVSRRVRNTASATATGALEVRASKTVFARGVRGGRAGGVTG
jgi:uncharacterized repeat protein (TIGR01451 family)